MKRIFAGAFTFLFGVSAFALSLTGSWEARVDVLPALELGHISFTIGVTNRELTICTTSVFEGDEGFTEERFGITGQLGLFSLAGEALIAPGVVVLKSTPYTATGDPVAPPLSPPEVEWKILGPIYRSSYLRLGAAFLGADFSLKIEHFLEHVLEFSFGDFGQTWSTDCPSNSRYLIASRDREIDVPRVVISYYADAAKTTLIRREAVEGPFEVLPDLSDYTPAAKTYLQNIAAARATELGAAAFEVPPPTTSELVFKLWVPYYMRYTFTTCAPPFRAEAVFDDVGTGIQFVEATLSLEGISPCCGIGIGAELSFTKCRGFEYLEIRLQDALRVCCGLDFDVTLRFTTTHNTISLEFEGLTWKPCVKIYAEPEFIDEYTIGGLNIYGFEICCDLGDRSYAKIVTAFNVFALEDILEEDIFQGDEFQYLEVGVCGEACCGQVYQFKGFIFFQESGSFMGITRVGAELTFSLFRGFTFGFRWDTSPLFSFTWTLSF